MSIDDRVAAFIPPHRAGDLRLAARIAHALGFRYLSWLYLMEREARNAL